MPRQLIFLSSTSQRTASSVRNGRWWDFSVRYCVCRPVMVMTRSPTWTSPAAFTSSSVIASLTSFLRKSSTMAGPIILARGMPAVSLPLAR